MAKLTDEQIAQHRRDIFGRAKHMGFYRMCGLVLDALEAKASKSRSRKPAEAPADDQA